MSYWMNTRSHSISSLRLCGSVEASISLMNAFIYVNGNLSQEEREEVILHELGHINHDPANYKRLLYKYENEADRFMIRHLISEELTQYEVSDFNWLQFAERHKISTTWGEDMIQEEFYRFIEKLGA